MNQPLDHIEILVGERGASRREACSCRHRLSLTIFAREQSARQREKRDERQPQALALRQHTLLWLAMQQAVLVLYTHEVCGAWLHCHYRLAYLLYRELRAANLTHLASAHQLVQRAECVGNRH